VKKRCRDLVNKDGENKGDFDGRLLVGQIQTGKTAILLRDNQT
jgi:hypothetical protein